MRVTVTATGPSLADVTQATIRDLRAVNKSAGKTLGKVGTDAINAGAPAMFGKKLRGAATVEVWPDRVEIEYHAAKGQAGGWQIVETGARPHTIARRRARALKFGDQYATTVAHPGTSGRRAWTRAEARLLDAVAEAAEELYSEGLGAT